MSRENLDNGPLEKTLARLVVSREDPDAWADLYRLLWPWVVSNVYRDLRGSSELAEDAGQEVFIRVLRYCPFSDLTNPQAFRSYLWTICKNVSRNYLSKLSERRVLLPDMPYVQDVSIESYHDMNLTETDPALTADLEDPRLRESESELLLTLKDLIGDLDKKDRDLIILIIEGYSLGEISQQMKMTYSNTGVRLHRLRIRLRKCLRKDEAKS